MTIIRIASDLHLEGYSGKSDDWKRNFFLPSDPRDKDAILILAGDICSKFIDLVPFLWETEKHFRQVIYVPGNHEAYKSNMDDWNTAIKAVAFNNTVVTDLYQVNSTTIDNTRFIFGTLWGDGGLNPIDEITVQHGLYDFKYIRHYVKGYSGEERNFTVDDMKKIYECQRDQIKARLGGPAKNVVITHHLPTRHHIHPRFLSHGDSVNGGFVGDCEDILQSSEAPQVWIHGHTHDTQDNMYHNTRIVCNPAGYKREYETNYNRFFEAPKFIEI